MSYIIDNGGVFCFVFVLTCICCLQAKYLAKKSSAGSVEAVKNLDQICQQLSVSFKIDVYAVLMTWGNDSYGDLKAVILFY